MHRGVDLHQAVCQGRQCYMLVMTSKFLEFHPIEVRFLLILYVQRSPQERFCFTESFRDKVERCFFILQLHHMNYVPDERNSSITMGLSSPQLGSNTVICTHISLVRMIPIVPPNTEWLRSALFHVSRKGREAEYSWN